MGEVRKKSFARSSWGLVALAMTAGLSCSGNKPPTATGPAPVVRPPREVRCRRLRPALRVDVAGCCEGVPAVPGAQWVRGGAGVATERARDPRRVPVVRALPDGRLRAGQEPERHQGGVRRHGPGLRGSGRRRLRRCRHQPYDRATQRRRQQRDDVHEVRLPGPLRADRLPSADVPDRSPRLHHERPPRADV